MFRICSNDHKDYVSGVWLYISHKNCWKKLFCKQCGTKMNAKKITGYSKIKIHSYKRIVKLIKPTGELFIDCIKCGESITSYKEFVCLEPLYKLEKEKREKEKKEEEERKENERKKEKEREQKIKLFRENNAKIKRTYLKDCVKRSWGRRVHRFEKKKDACIEACIYCGKEKIKHGETISDGVCECYDCGLETEHSWIHQESKKTGCYHCNFRGIVDWGGYDNESPCPKCEEEEHFYRCERCGKEKRER
ncbi:hypothetical protein ACFL1O_00075 [Patescibacteria group bacterium]